tara:strand:+ start:1085 stop:2134 length:1050 start_codon:yes stop_codon:yes gene_type:complete
MGGGLLQLVAYGAQDVYLTGNPQITFFKVVYRRHTNFSIESIQQTFNGNAQANNRVTCQISRNGDLVHKLYVEFTPKDEDIDDARECIKKVEVEIGGQLIDRQYGDWMKIWNELTLPAGKETGYNAMIKAESNLTPPHIKAYVPLEFWFCRNIGLALPLIALQYHEVKINIEFSDQEFGDATLWADYIFLDTDERRRFAQLSHEYLIEQVQFTGGEAINSSNLSAKLSFNHPVKELIWQEKDKAKLGNTKLMLNGNDRFAERDTMYFTHVQPYQHHTNIPDSGCNINVYSFALKPEEHQPSGTLNMSRIDTAQLKISDITVGTGEVKIYAHSYNVLRILSGMGGLAYSN